MVQGSPTGEPCHNGMQCSGDCMKCAIVCKCGAVNTIRLIRFYNNDFRPETIAVPEEGRKCTGHCPHPCL